MDLFVHVALQPRITLYVLLKAGNDFGEEFDELQYVVTPVMIIKLKVEEPKIIFEPPFRECRDIILRCFSEVIASATELPRVSFRSNRTLHFFIPLSESRFFYHYQLFI